MEHVPTGLWAGSWAGRRGGQSSLQSNAPGKFGIRLTFSLPMNPHPKAALKPTALQTLRAAGGRRKPAPVPRGGRVRSASAPLLSGRMLQVRFRGPRRENWFQGVLSQRERAGVRENAVCCRESHQNLGDPSLRFCKQESKPAKFPAGNRPCSGRDLDFDRLSGDFVMTAVVPRFGLVAVSSVAVPVVGLGRGVSAQLGDNSRQMMQQAIHVFLGVVETKAEPDAAARMSDRQAHRLQNVRRLE